MSGHQELVKSGFSGLGARWVRFRGRTEDDVFARLREGLGSPHEARRLTKDARGTQT